MCNVFKKYGKIIFLFMIVFIGSFFSIEEVEAAKPATFGYNIFNWNRYTVGCGEDLYLSGNFTSDKVDIVFNCGGTQKLDLRGHKLNAMDRILIEGNTHVYIYDSVGGGVVTNEAGGESTSDAGLYEVMAGSTLTIAGGTHRNSRTIGPIVKLFPTSDTDYETDFYMRGGRIERKYSDLSTISKSVQNSKRALIPIISSAGSNSFYADIYLIKGTIYDELTNGTPAGGFKSTEQANGNRLHAYSSFTTNTKGLFTNWSAHCIAGAVCDPDKFYIVYYDDSTELKSDMYEYGEGKSISYSPTKEGYKFEGWYTDSELTNKITSISSTQVGDINLYAKWTKRYTITYYNGDTKVKTQTYTPGTKQSLYEYSKTGYTFGGWYTDTKYTTKVTEISASTTGDKTYYAKMTANSYNINYYNGSTKITGLTPSTYTYGSGATLPSYSKTGYVFGGWYTDTNYTTKVTSVSASTTGDKTYYMKLTNASYSISYYDENSKLVNDLEPTSYTYGSGATLPTYTCPTGYKFVEWTNSSGTAISSISTSDTGNYSLYATCERNEYNIIYELNGGTNNDNNPKSYLLGSTWTLINGNTSSDSSVSLYNPTKTGYTFQGWYDNSKFTGTKLTSVDNSNAGDRTVYAKYTPNMYTVTLDDTLGGIKVTKAVFDSAMPDVTIPIRTGYDFVGYYSSSDVKYYDEYGKSAKNYDIASNATLFAKWTPKKYDITWVDGNGKTIYVDKVDYDSIPEYDMIYYGKPKKDMDKENGIAYKFKGWDPEVSIVTGDATYNATFEEASKFNINYYYGEVKLEGLEPSIYKVGEDTTLPTEIEGFTLDGWYLEKYFKTKITTISADSEGDINVYAKPEDVYNNEYLEDNLILHLDGINHGSVSDVWQDLSKNHNDVHLSENQVFEKNNLQTNKLVMNDSVAISENNIFENEPEEFTIEIVSEYYDDNTSIVAAIRDASDSGISGLDFIGYSDKQAVRLLYPSDGNSLLSQHNFEKKINEKVYRTITFNKTDNKMKVYESGTLVATVDVANGTAISNKKLQLGGLSFADNYGLNGAIYSVRIYDKELTQDEIGQNYMVDSERFSKEVDYEKENLIIHLDGTNPGNTDGIWQDLSGNGNHGTINGAIKNNNSYRFDGINDYISFAKSHSYDDLTIETIVSSSSVGTIIANFETGGYGLQIDDTNIVAKSYIDSDYSTLTKNKNDINDVVHLTYTVDSNYQKLYIDGSLVASKKVEGTIKNLEEENIFLTLGANPNTDGYSEYFNGSIYSLKLYSKVLSDGEVKQNYELDNNKYKLSTDYVSDGIIINLDGTNSENTDEIWKDISGNGNHATMSGTIHETDGYTFDGIDDYGTFQSPHNYKNITVEAVISNPNVYENNEIGNIISNYDDGGYGLSIIKDRNIRGSAYINDEYSSLNGYYNSNSMATVTFTYDGNIEKFYLDGELVDSKEIQGKLMPSSNLVTLLIGANPAPDGFDQNEFFKGTIHAIRIYDEALSENEIKHNSKTDKIKYASYDYNNQNLIINLDGTNPGNADGIWQDISGNGNHGTINGPTKSGNGYKFDGVDDYVDFGKKHFYDNVTMEAVLSFNSSGVVVGNYHDGGYGISISENGIRPSHYIGEDYSAFNSYPLGANKIIYVSYTYDGIYQRFYVNGEIYEEKKVTGIPVAPSLDDIFLTLGANPDGDKTYSEYFNGTIYATRLYSKALTTEEIKNNYAVDVEKYNIVPHNYIRDNIIFNLDGTNKGNVDGIWQDVAHDNDATIYGATIDGNSYYFDGIDDYAVISGDHLYENVTIETIINAKDLYGTIVGNYESGGYGIYFNENKLGAESFIDTLSDYSALYTSILNNETVSIAYTYDGKYQKLYINGNLIVNKYIVGKNSKGTSSLLPPLMIGTNPGGTYENYYPTSEYFKGNVYAVRMYSDALTETEIRENYKLDKKQFNIVDSEKTDGKLILHLDGMNHGNTDGIWQDISGNGNHATINGATWNGNGLKFDGIDDYAVFENSHLYDNVTMEVAVSSKITGNIFANFETGGYGIYEKNNRISAESYINGGYSALSIDELTNDEIVYITYTYDGSYQKIYLNGKLVVTKEISGKNSSSLSETNQVPLTLGADPNGLASSTTFSGFANGTIYSAKLYSKALTSAEVKADYEMDKAKYSNSFDIEYYNGSVKLEGIEPSSYEQGIGTELVETELEGYTFNGWYTSSTFEEDTKKENISASDTGNIKLYAKFDTNQYTITFEENGGSEVEDITADYASEVELPTPTKENFVFGGWYTDETLETEATNIVPSSDVTYYAKWIGEKYNITYYNGETELTGLTNEYMYGEGLILPTEVEGYEFAGWYTDAELTEESKVTEILPTETGDKVFYAKVIIQEYTISFETNGGTEIAPITGEYGTEVVKPVDPTKEHYTFEGWYSDETLETKYEITTIPGEDITLYANWTADKHKITWLNSDGTEIYIGDVDYGTLPVYDEETYGLPVSPEEVDGYEFVFKGWDKELVEVTEDATYTAVYEQKPLEYNITYYVGGVVLSSLTPNTYVYGVGTELAELDLTGYTLEGWYTSPLFEEETKVEKITETDLGDKVLYAKLSNTVYTLTFEENGGSEVENITAEFETPITAPTEPTKEGHTFVGWFDDETLTNEFEFTTMPGVDMTLYAKWEANKYTIEYYNGDIKLELMPNEYTYGIETPLPTEIEGYDFTGWYLDKDLTSEVQTAISATDTENKVFYTSTTIGTYTITFEENGGSEIEDITAEFESQITKPVDPTKVGNTFDGWYIDAEFTTPFEFTTMPGKDTTLYAKWVPEKHTITWSNSDGTEIYSEELDYGTLPKYNEETYGLPTYEKEGYTTTFTSWDSEIVEVTENKTYTAIYDEVANTYTITYYDGEDMLYLEPSEYVYGIGTELPTYQRDDLVVENWYTSPTFEEETKVEKITEFDLNDKVLYAKMEKIKYTISFEENGGTEVQDIKGEFGTDVTAPQAPTKENYTFDNWYIDTEFTTLYEFTTMPENDITLYAKWNANKYAINYYNGAIKLEGLEPSKHVYGEKTTLSTEVEGYTFEGWFSTPTFDEGTQVTEISETTNAEITVYAKMSINTYTITFEENGGSEVEDITGEYGNVITLPIPTYSDETYELDGWYTSPTFEEDTKFESTTIPGENTTLYAKWNLKEYKVTWNNADGTEIYSENVTYGTLPEYDTETYGIPTKEQTDAAIAYEFIGWDKEIANVTEDVTYTAQFKEIIPEYKITYYYNNSYPIYDLIPETYTYGVETTIPAYEEAGYEFGGWYTSGTFEEDTKIEKISSTTYGDITLYAKMTAKQYTLTFEENGGSEVENITQGYETEIELPIPTYSDEHYMLEGWYTSPTFEEGTKFESLIMPGEDMTLYAKWTQQQYTIEFNSNGGSEVESITDVYGATVTKPVDPTLEGYEFGGWYIDETLETPYEFTTMPDEDITVYAKWNIGKYTITFETNGGSEIEPIEAEYGSVVTAPTEPTKTGNVFDGWYADENFETLYEFTTMPAENVTVYAKWYTNEYTITFNSLGGSEVESITDVYGSTITAPTEPTKEGYDFKGWYTDAEFTTPFEFTTMPAEDMMLYAKWTAGVYTISWVNPDGTVIYQEEREYGEIPSYDEETYGIPTYNKTGYTTVFKNWDKEPEEIKTDQTYTAIYDETANTYNITYYNGEVKLEGLEPSTYTYEVGTELPVYEVEHYTFGGWYTSPTFEEETKVEKITETDYDDKTLYAKLTINQYTITFDSNEGSEVEAITGDYGTVVTAPTEPTKEGHTFAGWYSDETLENLYEFTTIPGENITVYAKWDINQYTITFEENDGSEVEDITADYNTTITKPVDPTKEHYTFDNWYVDAEFTTPYEFTTMPAENITLYAKWNVNQYKVTWNNIDGTEIYSEELDYGTLPEYDTETYGTPTFAKDGYTYTFKGWDPEVSELTSETTYTATYEEVANTYNITYYNGEVKLEGLEPSSYVYGIGTELPTYEMNGYTFEGWYSDETLETKVEKITETDLEDKVLYANMVRNEFTIYFETNGGTTIEPIKQTAGEPITAPTEPTKVGYVFDNWYTDETLETPFEFNVMPENDITLYAKWNEIQIEIVNKEIELFVDEEQQININTIPEGATLTFTYTPTDNIVSVSETGLIKGLTAGETTVTVKVTENPNIEETITVNVNSKEIESETYSVEQKEDVKIVIGMDEGVTIETLLNSLTNKSDYLNVYDKEGNKITDHTQVVSTGLKIKLEKEDKVYDEVTTIVRGDVNEDGIINITDKLTLVNHIVAKEEITDYRIYACELEIDGIINVSDKLKLVEYIVQKIPTLN